MFKAKERHLILTQNFKTNICNPCFLEVPEWCKKKLGKYYLYFADHRGKFIKLAYSNKLYTDWKIKKNGVLNINKFSDAFNHIASPEILIDNRKKKFFLFTHSHSKSQKGQWTYVSESKDGINFKIINDIPLAPFYFRIFKFNKYYYGITKGGGLWKSRNFDKKFKQKQNLFYKDRSFETLHNYNGAIRHLSLYVEKNILYIFFSKIGDSPERIYYSKTNLLRKEKNWFFNDIKMLMKPKYDFEGVKINLKKSQPGDTLKPENALRDPYFFKILNDYYLTYCVKGEFGIAIAELIKNEKK